MKKRILAAILASLMLLSTATACSTGGEENETADQSQTQENTETSGTDEHFPDIPKQDYGGASFHMIGWGSHGNWIFAEEYQTSGENINVLNNTVYEMNTLVEEHLNVELSFESVKVSTGNEVFNTVNPTMMAGDDTYQLCTLEPYYDNNNFVTKNYALDLHELEAINPEQSYWNKDVMDMLSIRDHAYLGVGDICNYRVFVIYCNKDMLGRVSREVPYAQVRNGEWTLDRMITLSSDLYADNGDGKRNELDVYGFANNWDINGTTFLQASNIYVAAKTEEGDYELTLYSDKMVDLYDKLYEWSKTESIHVWNPHSPDFTVSFANEQSYFTLDALGVQYLKSDFRAGILPMPKYDVAQESYAHQNWGNNILVPNTIRNKEMVGQVIELMAYYCSTMVTDKYYDEVLQLRVSEAPDDRDMVELIYDTVVFDPGIAYSDGKSQLWDLVYILCFGIREDQSNITSYYQSRSKAAEKWLSNIVDIVERNENR